jgi:hypothetical protein
MERKIKIDIEKGYTPSKPPLKKTETKGFTPVNPPVKKPK